MDLSELQIVAPKQLAEDTARDIEAVLSNAVEESLDLPVFRDQASKWNFSGPQTFDMQKVKETLASSRVIVTSAEKTKKVSEFLLTPYSLTDLLDYGVWTQRI